MSTDPKKPVDATDLDFENPLEDLGDADAMFATPIEEVAQPLEPEAPVAEEPKDAKKAKKEKKAKAKKEAKKAVANDFGLSEKPYRGLGVFFRQCLDIYTVMLGLSALALLLAVLCLLSQLWEYKFDVKANEYRLRRVSSSSNFQRCPITQQVATFAENDCTRLIGEERC